MKLLRIRAWSFRRQRMEDIDLVRGSLAGWVWTYLKSAANRELEPFLPPGKRVLEITLEEREVPLGESPVEPSPPSQRTLFPDQKADHEKP